MYEVGSRRVLYSLRPEGKFTSGGRFSLKIEGERAYLTLAVSTTTTSFHASGNSNGLKGKYSGAFTIQPSWRTSDTGLYTLELPLVRPLTKLALSHCSEAGIQYNLWTVPM